jgi:copper transport protein
MPNAQWRSISVVCRAFVAGLLLASLWRLDLLAHAALRFSTPMEGATLGDTPSTIRLALTEKPEAALSEIHVIDRSGIVYDVGRPSLAADDPMSLTIAVRPLPTGVYTVNWRVVSAIDGHAAAGAYAFGVRQSPGAIGASRAAVRIPPLEVLARWLLNAGLVMLIGAAFGYLAGFARRRAVPLAAAGWLLSSVGVAMLLAAQQRNAATSITGLLGTSIGRAIVWRAGALVAAGLGLAAARRVGMRRAAMSVVLIAALAAVAAHAVAGHAAARSAPALEIVTQWLHFAACGVWIGGLAALLIDVRDAASEATARAVARFSAVAAAGILIVLATGAIRALAELTAWTDLTRTAYGRTLFVKLGLFVAIAILGAANRLRSVAVAHRDLAPLRRTGGAELAFAGAALAAAGLLATLAPPASTRAIPGIAASGVDFATTTRVSLAAASNQPGPNRFVVRVTDYDSKKPLQHAGVVLRFAPIDDPGLAPTTLKAEEAAAGEYAASGANLAFDGRWRVTVQVQRGASAVEVPLDVDVTEPALPVDVRHVEGAPVQYNALVRVGGFVRFALDPERAGRSRLLVSCYDMIGDERSIEHIVVTHASGAGAAKTVSLRPLSGGRFAADVDVAAGLNRFTAAARTADGLRFRASVTLPIR